MLSAYYVILLINVFIFILHRLKDLKDEFLKIKWIK